MAVLQEWHGAGVFSQLNADGTRTFYAAVHYQGHRYSEAVSSTEKLTPAAALKRAQDRRGKLREEIREARRRGESWTPPASKKRAAAKAIPAPAPAAKPAGVTLEQFGEQFLRDWVGAKRSATWYGERLKQINRHLGATPLRDLNLAACQRFYTARVQETSVSTANGDLKALSVMLNRAVEWEALPVNPALRVHRERAPELPERFLYAEETKRLRAAYPSRKPWVRAVIETALATGMRRGELLRLDWEKHVDLGRLEIRLAGETKGKRGRIIPINATLKAELDALPRSTATTAVFHAKGKPVTEEILRNEWEALRAAAELDPAFRFHDLRHTAASWLVMQGRPLTEVQRILGHSTLRQTERYAHFAPGFLRETTRALDGYAGPTREAETVSQTVSRESVGA